MLGILAERDAPVELSRQESGSKAPPLVYKTRLFMVLEDGSIVVETPQRAVRDKSFGNGDDVELTLMHNSERLIATCTILETNIREINENLRVLSYRLSPGRRPQRDQRRSFFRVGVAAMDLKPVVLSYEVEREEDEEKTVYQFKAQLVNISAGGLGVSIRASRGVLGQIKRSRKFDCHAVLGGVAVDAPVHVAHIAAIGDDGLYLGLSFEPDNEADARSLEDTMLQRCTEFQRMQLKKRRA